ncbi:hypothetical protein B5S31_g371 [[Candida] boidinii]|nr:hypothetical protein B5S31_g371 [[Candida] boidinii]
MLGRSIIKLQGSSTQHVIVSSAKYTRTFTSSYKLSNKTEKSDDIKIQLKKIDKELNKLAKEPTKIDHSLINRPDLWKGLPDDVISSLYRERVLALGKNYKPSEEELKAVLSTAKNPLQAEFIKTIYNETEADIFETDEVDYDNYISEGNFMDESEEPREWDEHPTIAQDIVRDFRDQLKFNRIAAYEMPHLAEYRQEYKPTDKKLKPVTYRYTSYLGEDHPAEKKVVLTLKVADLQLSEKEAHKFKLLSGVRYDHIKDILKMSSDKFLEPAQNTTYLSDIIDDLIKESKNKPEEFEDVPLDTRHTVAKYSKKQNKTKKIFEFPKEWEKPIDPKSRKVEIDSLLHENLNFVKNLKP